LRNAFALAGLAIVLTACGGGTASQNVPAPAARGTLVVRTKVPVKKGTRHGARYISPASQGITIALSGLFNFSVSEAASLLQNGPGCTGAPSATTCTLTIPGLPPGPYSGSIATYDAIAGYPNACTIPGSAHELSGDQAIAFRQGTRMFSAESLDAAGAMIVGAGSPTFTTGTPSGVLTGVAVTTPTTSGAFTVTPPATYSAGTASIAVTPTTNNGPSGGALSVTAYDSLGNEQTLASGSFPHLVPQSSIAYDAHNELPYIANAANGASGSIAGYDLKGTQQQFSGTLTIRATTGFT
jgi:hypothetical protein